MGQEILRAGRRALGDPPPFLQIRDKTRDKCTQFKSDAEHS